MAAVFCTLNQGAGLKKLNEYLLHQSCMRRSYLESKRSSHFFCKGRKLFHASYRRKLQFKRGDQSQKALLESKDDYSGTANEDANNDNVSKATLIWRAVKLPIYSVALIPLTSPQTGADKNKRESVVNLVGSRTGTLIAAYSFLVLGFMGLTWASMEAGNMRSLILLACAIVCGYIYQCPPFRLSYQGLGEPLCFAAFGPFASSAFYLLQGSTSEMNCLPLSGTILSASILVGLTTALILFCSHFHQVEGDRAVGKMSPLVRLGTKRGSTVVKVAVIALYILLLALGLIKAIPFTCLLLCALTSPVGKLIVNFVEDNHKDKQEIFRAKYYCVRLHALFGAALAAGLVVARMIPKTYGAPRLI